MIPCISLNPCQEIQRLGKASHHPVRNLLAPQCYRAKVREEVRSREVQWKGFPRLPLRGGFFSRQRFHPFVYRVLCRQHRMFLLQGLILVFQSSGSYDGNDAIEIRT